MKRTLTFLALAGLLAAPAAQAQNGAVFRPTGGWIADYGDDYCRLARTFSDGKNELSVALERIQPTGQVRFILVGGGIRPFRGADQLGYQLLPSGSSQKVRYVRAETPDGKPFLSLDPIALGSPPAGAPGGPPGAAGGPPAGFTPPPPGTPPPPPPPYNRARDLESAQAVTGIAIGEGLTDPVRIETGPLRAPIAAMQACADDLLTVWGLDADKHKTMTAPAVLNPNPDGVLPQGTIPFTEFSKFLGGANQVRLLIGADGKPTACTIYSPSLSQSLNNRICSLAMQRATFQPAKDAAGQPMASYWYGSPMFLGAPPRGGFRGG